LKHALQSSAMDEGTAKLGALLNLRCKVNPRSCSHRDYVGHGAKAAAAANPLARPHYSTIFVFIRTISSSVTLIL
jgi:hypothetical protein